MNIDDKIKYLRKHFKRNKNIFELILIKYESINYYIRVDYNPSLKAHYLYSCDLDYLDKKKDKYINRQFIKAEALNYVLDIYDTIQYESFEDLKYTTDIVELNINNKTFKFNRYIPVKYYDLCACTLLAGLFMPARLTTVFDELVAEINGVSYRYEYKKEFKFDIYKTDLDRIFSFDIINQAEEVLKNDKTILKPIYDFTIHNRSEKTVELQPKKIVIVEGIMALVNKDIRSIGDLKIFINASRERRLLRRMDRDQKERGRSVDSIINQYFATVQPMYEEIIEPSSYYADMLINNDGYDNKSIEVLAAVLRALVNGEME